MSPIYLVPSETKQLAEKHLSNCQNLKLILARFVPQEVIKNEDYPERKGRKWKDHWLQNVLVPRFKVANSDQRDWRKLIDAEYGRWNLMTAEAQRFIGQLQGRLLVGFGGKGVADFGLTLSHVTGLPVIPGSALKGVARTYGLLSIAADLNLATTDSGLLNALDTILAAEDRKAEEKDLLNKALDLLSGQYQATHQQIIETLDARDDTIAYRDAFGSQDNAGMCVFYDAVVERLPPPKRNETDRNAQTLFEADVMTPHFKDYYDKVNAENPDYAHTPAPHDGMSPVPIPFLAVAAKTQFAFAVGVRRTLLENESARKAQVQALNWLQNGLYELGIGAKTAAGYGVFGQIPSRK